MTLEELKAAMEAAKAKADADPTKKELATEAAKSKKAYDDAVAADALEEDPPETDPENTGVLDESKLDKNTKAYLEKLRKENAKHRTKNKDIASKLSVSEAQKKAILKAAGIEDDSETPEAKVKTLSEGNQTLAFNNAILESAIEHGIPQDGIKYFKFLVSEAAAALQEGEDLDEDKMKEIATEAKKGRVKESANSSVHGDGKGKVSPAPGTSNEITLGKFCSMSISEKSKLFETNRDLYNSLVAEARKKGKLV